MKKDEHRHSQHIKDWADGWEMQYRAHAEGEWFDLPKSRSPQWEAHSYRRKPEPLECWVNMYPDGFASYHCSKCVAEKFSGRNATRTAVHMREVE